MKEVVLSEKTCTGDHAGHLCVLASQERFDEIQKMVGQPAYICFNCGRVADNACNLCNPMPLSE